MPKTFSRFGDEISAFSEKWALSGRLVITNGRVIDPFNRLDEVTDISIASGKIERIESHTRPERGDAVLNADGLLVVPGLVDIHLHMHDLFEVSTKPIMEAAADGVTSAITPGAGNTLMAPSLMAAEVDRGLPMNVGLLLGAAATLAPRATIQEKIRYFKGEMEHEEASKVISRNAITNHTGPLTIGIKDHMGHYLLSDEDIDSIFELTSKAKLYFMSHTQCPDHAERVVDLSRGRLIHLGHATAAGAGTHGDPVESMERVITLVKKNSNVSAEFVTSHLRPSRGNRDGILIDAQAQEVALEAVKKGHVKVLISDGQSDTLMKGFGDTRDNIPVILELAEKNILSLSEAVSLMTLNPAVLLSKFTSDDWWVKEIGSLSPGSRADVTIVDPLEKEACATVVNGQIVSFEGRLIRSGYGAGGLLTRKGILDGTGLGYSNIIKYNI